MSFFLKKNRSRRLYPKLVAERSIRVLTLLPAAESDPVQCTLNEEPLRDAAGSYKALSYAWHDSDNAIEGTDIREITCNKTSFPVSQNLYAALSRLRRDMVSVKIWVDRICINQESDAERTHQVGIMRDIYASSNEVIIWLGDSNRLDHLGEWVEELLPRPEQAFQWFDDERDQNKLDAYRLPTVEQFRANQHADTADIFGAFYVLRQLAARVEASSIQELRHLTKAGPIVNGFESLIAKTWWQRVWVVQEVVVVQNATVYYGRISAPWAMFARAALWFDERRLSTNSESVYPYMKDQSLMRFARLISEIESTRKDWMLAAPIGMLQLLRKFRSRLATDERDKVFALLGLVRFWGRLGQNRMRPNYSLNIEDVFRDTARTLLISVGSLQVLAGTMARRDPATARLPSWVVDWSSSPEVNEHTRLSNLLLYGSGGLHGLTRLHGHQTLEVEGIYTDHILCIGEELLDVKISRMRLMMSSWSTLFEEEVLRHPGDLGYVGGGSLSDAFWRTICGDLEYNKQVDPKTNITSSTFRRAAPQGSEVYEKWRSTDTGRRRTTSIISGFWQELVEDDPEAEKGNAFHHAVECASQGRKFFVTKNGYIGTGPNSIKEDDAIFVLSGSQVPFVLRRVSIPSVCRGDAIETLVSSSLSNPVYIPAGRSAKAPSAQVTCWETHTDCWFLVGDAYVHGIMDGEMLQSSSNMKQKVFLV